MPIRFILACALAVCPFFDAAHAHHGLDFLLVKTPHLPEQGSGYAAARLDHISERIDEQEFEPAVLYGATDWMTVEVHAHYERQEGKSSKYESVAPALHFRLTPRQHAFSIGVSAEYELAHRSDEEDIVELAAVFGYEMDRWTVSGDLLYGRQSGTSGEWAYAAGLRHTFHDKHGVGVEARGSLESDGHAEMLVGYYGEFSDRFTFNAGLGGGIDDGPDWTARLAFIWRFK